MKNMNIHQIWIGDNPPPYNIKKYINSIKKHNNSYKHILWNNRMVMREFPDEYKFIKQNITPTFVSNILRFKILHKYGGWYIDADFYAIDSLNRLSVNHTIPVLVESDINDLRYSNGTMFFPVGYNFDFILNGYYPDRPMIRRWNQIVDKHILKKQYIGNNYIGENGSILVDTKMRSFARHINNNTEVAK